MHVLWFGAAVLWPTCCADSFTVLWGTHLWGFHSSLSCLYPVLLNWGQYLPLYIQLCQSMEERPSTGLPSLPSGLKIQPTSKFIRLILKSQRSTWQGEFSIACHLNVFSFLSKMMTLSSVTASHLEPNCVKLNVPFEIKVLLCKLETKLKKKTKQNSRATGKPVTEPAPCIFSPHNLF